MKELLQVLQREGLLFRRLEPFDLRRIGSRKRIDAYLGVDLQNRYALVFRVAKKSRVLRKEAQEWMALHQSVERHLGHPVPHRVAAVEAPLCSKARNLLEEAGWRVLTR